MRTLLVKTFRSLHWICEDCNPVATRTLKMLTKMYEKQETMERDMEYLKKIEVVAVRDLTEATQKDSQSMCGSIVACESSIKELNRQL